MQLEVLLVIRFAQEARRAVDAAKGTQPYMGDLMMIQLG